MAGTLTISTLSDGTNSTSSTNCIQGSAKAWCNFNGNSGASPVIRASYNVSSVVRNAQGDYTVNFTNAFADANYCVTTSLTRDTTNNNYGMTLNVGQATSSFYATTFVRLYGSYVGATTLYDQTYAHVSIFR